MAAKIIIAAHKPYAMPAGACYLPVQVGAALATTSLGFQRDDVGENISARNPNWCELTALYWAWKNLRCDYLGLAHYRRLFRGKAAGALTDEELAALLARCPIVLPRKRNYFIESSYSHYAHAHHAADLDETRLIIAADHPDYLDAFDSVMRRTSSHRFNMFIMRRDLADDYCAWLFDILFKLERRLDISSYNKYDARVFGFVSERLLDVWLTARGHKFIEVPLLNLESQHWPRKALNFLLRKFLPKRLHPAHT